MSVEVRGLGDVELPAWARQVIDVAGSVAAAPPADREARLRDALSKASEPLLASYAREIGRHGPWLERKGREAVRAAAGSILSKAAPKAVAKKLPKPPDLVARLADPALGPFLRGAKAEAWRIGRPLLIGGAILFAGTLAGSFALGRATAGKRSLTARSDGG